MSEVGKTVSAFRFPVSGKAKSKGKSRKNRPVFFPTTDHRPPFAGIRKPETVF